MKLANEFSLNITEKKTYARKQDKPWLDLEKWRYSPFPPDKTAKIPAWQQEFGGRFYMSETHLSVKGANKPYPRFNFNSVDDMKWLIYEKWIGEGNWKIKSFTPRGETKEIPYAVVVAVGGEDYDLDLTKTKGLPTGGDILKLFGEEGQMIADYKKLLKISGDFLQKFHKASELDGRIHTSLKIYGAATGRGAGA